MANKTLTTQIILRNGTSSEWEASTKILKLGEVGIDTTKNEIRIGDGTHTWKDLKIAGADQKAIQTLIDQAEDKVTVVQAGDGTIDQALATITSPSQGDMAIIEQKFGDVLKADGTRTSRTAYSYDGAKWCAMDGNYNAENVYFDSDLTYTAPIGVKTVPASGFGTISAAGKNVKEVLASILAKEKNPDKTNPAVSFNTQDGFGTYEIGTKKNLSYTASLSAGSYTYGPATGIAAQSWSVSCTDVDGVKTSATGTFENVVAEATAKTITATATYNEGAVPNTNLGNKYPAGKIAAGSASKTSKEFVGVRYMFWGPMTTDEALNSAAIRGLAHNKAAGTGDLAKFGAGAGAKKVIVAVPSGRKITKVIMPSALNADVTALFVKQSTTVPVEGANGYTAAAYDVYVYQPASIDAGETYIVTIG